MHPGATLFLDCCAQEEFWPDGSWPLVNASQAVNIERLFAFARELTIRQGGILCRHLPGETRTPQDGPVHCREGATWSVRPPGCQPVLPIVVARGDAHADDPPLDRTCALYLDSGCAAPPDSAFGHRRAFAHLTAGVRDAVVFGAGVEHAMARAVEALLARRIRTHVALDAAGAADEIAAQLVIADWKRRGVDVTTVAMVERMLLRN